MKGFTCTSDAQAVFKQKCPALDIDDLATANYEAEHLWTANSIATVRLALVSLWLAAFVCLSVVIGSFVVHQAQLSNRPARRSIAITEN